MAKPKHDEYSLWVKIGSEWQEIHRATRLSSKFAIAPTRHLRSVYFRYYVNLDSAKDYKILPTGNKP